MSIKTACDDLESAFNAAEARLDKVTEKVDQAIAQTDSKSVSANGPSHLLQSLKDIKAEHSSIVKQVQELKETQNAFIADILKDLQKLEEAEAQLVAKVGGEAAIQKKE